MIKRILPLLALVLTSIPQLSFAQVDFYCGAMDIQGRACRKIALNIINNRPPNFVFRLMEGTPGQLDSITTWYTWTPTEADTGWHSIRIIGCDTTGVRGCGYCGVVFLVYPALPLQITTGCGVSTVVTDSFVSLQMGATGGCDRLWELNQVSGPSTARCEITTAGLITFSAPNVGTYEYQVVTLDSDERVSCTRVFEVSPRPPCCQGRRGNVDGRGRVDLTDLSYLISYLVGNIASLPCDASANVDAAGAIDLSDLNLMVNYLLIGTTTLLDCP